MNTDRLLNDQETSQLIGRARQTLANDRSARRGLPYIKIGRSIRYRLSDVLAFIEARRINPEAQ
jgi:predicted DNA-binding transcriptional regulator AlpA